MKEKEPSKTYLVKVSEQTFYTLKIQASSASEARKIVGQVNKGKIGLSELEGGDSVSNFGRVIIRSIEEESEA